MANINDFGFPFSSVTGDRQYSSAEWRNYFGTLIKDGLVQNSLNECQVKPQVIPNKTVYVDTGTVFIQGAMRIVESIQTVTINDNTSGNPRIDRIVARLNFSDRKIEFLALQGTPGGSPTAPALTRNTTFWELGLADIAVANGFSTITASGITDTRSDVNLCGAASMTIGVIPPSGLEAETVTLSTSTATDYGVLNVDDAFSTYKNLRFYGKYSQMSGGAALSGSAQNGVITYSAEDNDDFSAINIGTSASRITIPSGVGKAKFYINARIQSNQFSGGLAITLHLRKNGSNIQTLAYAGNQVAGDSTVIQGTFFSTPVDVSSGDYFEIYAEMNTSSGNSSSVSANSVFGMEVLS